MQGRGRGAARGRSGRGGRGRKQQHMSSTTSSSDMNNSNKGDTNNHRTRRTLQHKQNVVLVEDIATQELLQANKQIITNQSTLKQQTFNQYFMPNYVELPSTKSMHHNVHVPRLLRYVNVMRVHRIKSKLIRDCSCNNNKHYRRILK